MEYWTDPHVIHMHIVALVGAGLGWMAVDKFSQVLPTLKWNFGVLTEILWDLELFEETAPSLPGLNELISVVRMVHSGLSVAPKGPLNSSWMWW
jgi:hypothetical protein